MKLRQFLTITLLLLVAGVGKMWADDNTISIPVDLNTYFDRTKATLTNVNIDSRADIFGSAQGKDNCSAVFTVSTQTAGDYYLEFVYGTNGNTGTITATVANSDNTYSKATSTISIINGGWDCSNKGYLDLPALPAGTYTVTFALTKTSGNYAGNFGKIAIHAKSQWKTGNYATYYAPATPAKNFKLNTDSKDSPLWTVGQNTSTVSKQKHNPQYESANDNVGYIADGGYMTGHPFFIDEKAYYAINMGVSTSTENSRIKITVIDAITGNEEASQTYTVAKTSNYATQTFQLTNALTYGPKTLRLDFLAPESATEASSVDWLFNFNNLNVTKYANLNYYSVTATTSSENTGTFTLEGNKNSEGKFNEGSAVTITAIAKAGYKFSSWELISGTEGTANENVYTISSLGADTEVKANFTKDDSYDAMPGTVNLNHGTYSGCRTENNGANVGFTTDGCTGTHPIWVDKAGSYKMTLNVPWHQNKCSIKVQVLNGDTEAEEATATISDVYDLKDYECTFDKDLTAGAKKLKLTLTQTSGSGGNLINYKNVVLTYTGSETVTVSATASPEGKATFTYNPSSTPVWSKSVAVTATPAAGYKVSSWTLNSGTTGTADGVTYTISDIREATSLTANIVAKEQSDYDLPSIPLPTTINYLSLAPVAGKVEYSGGDNGQEIRYQSENENVGYVSNNSKAVYNFYVTEAGYYNLKWGVIKYNNGGTATITIKNYDTNEVEGTATVWTVDGSSYDEVQSFLLASKLTAGPKKMEILFNNPGKDGSWICNYKNMKLEKTNRYTATATVSPENSGTVAITPASSYSDGSYADGAAITMTATPATGYKFVSWEKVSGTEGAVSTEDAKVYKISALAADTEIKANFTLKTIDDYPGYDGMPGVVDLNNGTYTGGAVNEYSGRNIGFIKNGATSTHPIFIQKAGTYHLSFYTRNFYNTHKVTYTITNEDTNTPEASGTVADAISKQDTYGCDIENLTYGPKKLTLTFSSESTGYLENCQDITLAYTGTDLEYYAVSAGVEPEGAGTVTISPTPNAEGKIGQFSTVTFTATKNFGYKFADWIDVTTGTVLSTDATYKVKNLGAAVNIRANFDKVNTYALTVKTNRPTTNYVTASPAATDGKYEEGTVVTLTAATNLLAPFSKWDDESTEVTRTVTMTADKTVTATYGTYTNDYLAGWDFMNGYSDAPDFAQREENEGSAMYLYDVTTNAKSGNTYWNRGGYAMIWTAGDKYDYCAKVSSRNYKSIEVKANISHSYNVHAKTQMQWSTDGTTWNNVGDAVEFTSSVTSIDIDVTLPAGAEHADKLYIRWTQDRNSALIGTTSDNYALVMKNVYILGTYEQYQDNVAPAVTYATPAANSKMAKHEGTITLNFDKNVKLAANASATLNGKTLTGTVLGSRITFPYSDLSYNTEYTFTLTAASVTNENSVAMASDYTLTFTTVNRGTVETKHAFDYVVGVDGTADEVIAKANANTNDHVYIFVPNGSYKLTGNDGGDGNKTNVSKQVSIIGQSMDGAVLWNESVGWGISSTSTLNFTQTGNYLQDVTLKNWRGQGDTGKGVAVALSEKAQNIYKNVHIWSNQDTYVSSGCNYWEGGRISGSVDYICGGGNIWFEGTRLSNTRSGSVITAPSTGATEQWGYVFNNCTVDSYWTADNAPSGANACTNGGYTFGRPWKEAPKTTMLNTICEVLPGAAGWQGMSTGLAFKFKEFGTVSKTGLLQDLSGRSLAGLDQTNTGCDTNPVLTNAEALAYTLDAVMDANFVPTKYTEQCAAPVASLSGTTLSWTCPDDSYAMCYVIFRNGVYVANTTSMEYEITKNGTYTVRAANEMGGLGEYSNAVTLAAEDADDEGKVTITTSYNGYVAYSSTKDFTFSSTNGDVKAYYAKSQDGTKVTLEPLSDQTATIAAGEGIIFKGSASGETITITQTDGDNTASMISGNMLKGVISSVEGEGLASGTNYALMTNTNASSSYYMKTMFVKYTGTAERLMYQCYLNIPTQQAKQMLTISFEGEEATGISSVNNEQLTVNNEQLTVNNEQLTVNNSACYNLAGQRVILRQGSATGTKGIVIINGRKVINK